MKKVILFLVAILGISFAANAQSCKISGANDGSTVMVTLKFHTYQIYQKVLAIHKFLS